jgi:hypothetical protein
MALSAQAALGPCFSTGPPGIDANPIQSLHRPVPAALQRGRAGGGIREMIVLAVSTRRERRA